MDIRRAQEPDWETLRQLYHRNHPDNHRGFVRRWWHAQTFVMVDDGNDGRIIGFATATYAGMRAHRHGATHRHGAIRVLEIEPGLRAVEQHHPFVVRGLVNTCMRWMAAQGCTSALVPVLARPEYAWVLVELRASTGPRGLTIPITPRQPRWEWVLDPKTGLLYPEAGPEGAPPGPPPPPVQAARQVWA